MENLLSIYFAVELFVFVFVGVAGSLAIALSDSVYDMDEVLTKKEEFLSFAFQWQVAIYQLNNYIKPTGIWILIFLASIFVFPLNVLALEILCICELIRGIVWVFMKVFGKQTDS